MTRRIIHLDVDSFYASVEKREDPSLKDKPVVIGGKFVVATSLETQRSGVRPGQPLWLARRLCPRAVFLPGNYPLYQGESEKLYGLLSSLAPAVEQASVDDFFLDLSGCERLFGEPFGWAGKLKRMVEGETSLPLSLGLATSRPVARAATLLAKRGGMLEVLPGGEAQFLSPLPLGYLGEIGIGAIKRLEELGVNRIGEINIIPTPFLAQVLGERKAEAIKGEAQGRDAEPLRPHFKREILREMATLEDKPTSPLLSQAHLSALLERASYRLRQRGLWARALTLTLVYADNQSVSSSSKLAPTDQENQLYPLAKGLLQRLWVRRVRIRELEIRVEALPKQPELFPGRKVRLYQSIDRIRRRFGYSALLRASNLLLR